VERIREQLARSEAIRAWRAASVMFTASVALAGGIIQSRWDLSDPDSFLVLWITLAGVCMAVVSVEMIFRCRLASGSQLLRDATIVAARQFVPSVIAGGLITWTFYRHAPESIHLLPGLWSIVFGLGVFASRPGLPRAINVAGAYYLLAGVFVIASTSGSREFEAWPMPLCFGVGQLLTASILYLYATHSHDPI
jgi:hypothetical protein